MTSQHDSTDTRLRTAERQDDEARAALERLRAGEEPAAPETGVRWEAWQDGVCEELAAETLAEALAEAREWVRGGDYGTVESTIWVCADVREIRTVVVQAESHPCPRCAATGMVGDEECPRCDGTSELADEDLTLEERAACCPHCGMLVLCGHECQTAEEEEDVETVRVAIDPEEPECAPYGEEHDWQSPHEILGGCESSPGVWGHGGGVWIHEVCMRCGCLRVIDTWAQDMETGQQGLHSVRYEEGRYADEVRALRDEEVQS